MWSERIHFWMSDMWNEKCDILRETWTQFFEKLAPGAHFSKNLIHVPRKISHFSLHISIIKKCIISLHISHITFHVSHFKSLIYIHILHFTLYILLCEVWSVKWEMWNENHKSQFPDGKCDLWNRHEMWIQFLEKCAPGLPHQIMLIFRLLSLFAGT